MTTTDELREAVARAMAETADSPWNISFYPDYWQREADRIIRLVVDACAREVFPAAQAGFDQWAAKPHNKRWFRRIDGTPIPNDVPVCIANETLARIRALAPKEPAP